MGFQNSGIEIVQSNKIARRKLPFLELVSICLFGIFYIDFQIQGQYQLISPFIAIVYIGYCMLKDASIRKPLLQFLGCCTLLALMWQFLTIPVTIKGSDVGLKYFYSNFAQYLLTFFRLFFFTEYRKMPLKNKYK